MQRSFVISLIFLGTLALAAEVPTYSHFVRPDGSPTSSCSQAQPCTLARAFALAATPGMPCGSIVHVAAGYYVQAVLVYGPSQTCSADHYVKFIGDAGAVVTGLEVEPSAAGFRLTSGRTYTYEIAWNEADSGKFTVGVVAQREPSTWTSITVEDRFPPFDTESEMQFELDVPVAFTERSSIDEVELHRCTFWNDTSANKVYVHMCHNAIPVTNDDLYFGRARWGDIIVQGDGLWWENIDVRYVSLTLGAGLLVEPTAARTVVKLTEFRSAAVEMGGNGTLAEDIEIGYAIVQGPAADGCYDQDSNTSGRTARSCWNANGQSGALLLGIIGSSASSGQVVRRAYIHRSWNGAHVAGANTLEDSILWGFPNHNLTAGGTGGVIRSNVAANSQESIHLNFSPFDRLTIENNLFLHGALFWTSYNQDGGTPTTAWTFRNNIAAGLVIEDLTYPGLTSNCNLWIKDYRGPYTGFVSMDNPNYAGGAVFSHTSLADFRAAHPALDRNSRELPASKWTDGTQFANFVSQRNPTFSFNPAGPSAEALNMPACGRVGPSPSVVPAAPRNVRIIR